MKATIQKGLRKAGRWIRSKPAILAFLAGFGAALGGWVGYILYDISRRIDWYQVIITIAVLVFVAVMVIYSVAQPEDRRRR